eukprot:scaffold22560_cov135-Cylindrotheca_fusiformis.AAC.53
MAIMSTFKALTRANLAMLNQKADFIHLLHNKFGKEAAAECYQQICPIVQASVGQHIRHSMDHIELIVAAQQQQQQKQTELHYDLRKRGGSEERDIDVALKRIFNAMSLLQQQEQHQPITDNREMQAFFMLSGDPTEFQLSTTLERELGFGVHHAIHHMAMVKIIAVETLQIPMEELAPDFGRAPSTVVYDNSME